MIHEAVDQARLAVILKLRSEGATLEAIGQGFGITRERVRQICKRYDIHPPDCIAISVVAKDLGTSSVGLRALADELELEMQRVCGRWRVSHDDAERLADAWLEGITKKCHVCGKEFKVPRRQGARKYCGEKCAFKAWHDRRHNPAPTARKTSPVTIAAEAVTPKTRPGREYVGITECGRIIGISNMQVYWLAMRELIAVKDHPTRTWRDNPRRMYSKAHACAIRDELERLKKGERQ